MGLFRRFSGKKEVTTSVKNEVNRLVDHWRKALDKLNTTDNVNTYISTLEDIIRTAMKLDQFEKTYDWKNGTYGWSGGIQKILEDMDNNKSQNERAFIDRAYERLQRDCLKVSTAASKEKKKANFFTELEYYYKYFNEDTIAYIEYIKSLQG